jgi:serine phosphatase RsbU (regulator of sigma subunit)
MHEVIERELKRAKDIQDRLIPRNVSLPGLDFAIGFVPCRWVGGDYVDIVKRADGRVLLAIADVCGKGLPAALVASSLHMLTHTAMRSRATLSDMMQNLNAYLVDTLTEGTFVTMLAVMLDPAEGTLEIINAGHPAGLLLWPDGTMKLTQAERNTVLGIDAEEAYVSETVELARGAYLVLYTDGLSELNVGEGNLLGEDRLAADVAALVREGAGAGGALSSADLSARLTAHLDRLQEGMSSDDRTFLIARRV